MPWTASSVMEERLRFVARPVGREAMTDVCRGFGVSRKTGYKIFDRYKEHGLSALSDRSRRPVRYANQLPQQVESLIVRLKAEKPHWGARYNSRAPGPAARRRNVRVPAKSTIHAVSIATAWSSVAAGRATARAARRCPRAPCPMTCGAPTSKAEVQSATGGTAASADRHRPCLAFPAPVRSFGVDPRRPRLHGLRTTVP